MPDFLAQSRDLHAGFLFLTSLAVGLLIGLERQRKSTAKAGLRTCGLVALFGSICALLAEQTGNTWLMPVGLALVGAFIIGAYRSEERGGEVDSGTTTVIAVLLCYVYGVLVWYRHVQLAVAFGIVTTLLLNFKTELHGFTQRLSAQDIGSILQFGVLSFIVLPLLPNQGYGRGAVLNPYHLWLMVVLIVGLGLAGYLALRIVGTGRGSLLVGFFGGLVSSTATTLVYARQAAADQRLVPLGSTVITIANLVVLARLSVVGLVTTPTILPQLLTVIGAAVLTAAIPIGIRMRREIAADAGVGPGETPLLTNPTNLRVALGFGLLYAVVLLGAAWLSEHLGSYGLYALALVSGLVDVDAITLSSLQLFRSGAVAAHTAVAAITIAYLANVAFKTAVVVVVGGAALTRSCALGLAAPTLGMVAALLFT